jgi:3-ketosteroid 9alpha-monooxygenase subunit B
MTAEEPKPASPSSATTPSELVVRSAGQVHRLAYTPGDTLLETMHRAGVIAPYSCQQGICGTCMCKLLKGEVQLRQNSILTDDDFAQGYTLACQGEPVSAECEIEIEG